MTDIELRQHLQRIVNENIKERVGNQIVLIAELSKTLPHTIKLEREIKLGNDKSLRYNCFTYAFRLLESQEFVDIIQDYSFLFANSSYASYIIERHLTAVDENDVRDGDYALYCLNGKPKHAGQIRNNRVVSKWGTCHLWEHGLWEVPIEYGDEIHFFKQISVDECVLAFKTWVDTCR